MFQDGRHQLPSEVTDTSVMRILGDYQAPQPSPSGESRAFQATRECPGCRTLMARHLARCPHCQRYVPPAAG